jgi:hypothetical protein
MDPGLRRDDIFGLAYPAIRLNSGVGVSGR